MSSETFDKMLWYKIPEISKEKFLKIIKPIYDILEGRKQSKSEPDIFAKKIDMAFNSLTEEEWDITHKIIQKERALTMACGDLHQRVMGSIDGWEDYKTGHPSKCDIGNISGNIVGEIKNNKNTMNSNASKTVFETLTKQIKLGKTAYLIIINGDIPKKTDSNGIIHINGREFYKFLTKRDDFYENLESTLTECFKHYKTFSKLKEIILCQPFLKEEIKKETQLLAIGGAGAPINQVAPTPSETQTPKPKIDVKFNKKKLEEKFD